MANLEIDYKKAAQQLRSGEALFGKDGALAPMLERILNAALEGEMDAHLNSVDRSSGNRRNDKMSKTVQTKYGEVTVGLRVGIFPQCTRKTCLYIHPIFHRTLPVLAQTVFCYYRLAHESYKLYVNLLVFRFTS